MGGVHGVLVPGGQGTRTHVDDEDAMRWLASVADTATWTTSVCTGALLLHEAGPGRGRRLATHWGFEDELEARGADVVSSQGVSAGIDMALWLVGQLHGEDHARTTQRDIQYDPDPPYA